MNPIKVLAQRGSNLLNICVAKRGNEAPAAERMTMLAASAEAETARYASGEGAGESGSVRMEGGKRKGRTDDVVYQAQLHDTSTSDQLCPVFLFKTTRRSLTNTSTTPAPKKTPDIICTQNKLPITHKNILFQILTGAQIDIEGYDVHLQKSAPLILIPSHTHTRPCNIERKTHPNQKNAVTKKGPIHTAPRSRSSGGTGFGANSTSLRAYMGSRKARY